MQGLNPMGIFGNLLKREDPLVTTPPLTIVATKKQKSTPKKAVKKAPAKKTVAKKTVKRGPRRDYKGDVHWVVDLEGIGQTYAKRLQENGIKHTQHLLFASNNRLEKVTNAPAGTVVNWKHMAQLVKINGVGPQFAELMVRAGVEGIEDLKTLNVTRTVAQIRDYSKSLKSNVTGSGIGEKRLTDWQKEAKGMRKVAIDMRKITPVELESTAAKAPTKKASAKKAATKKAPTTKAAPKQVTRNGYLLYQSGSRYFFSKKKAPQKGWKKITTVPTGFKVKVTSNGLPVLARK